MLKEVEDGKAIHQKRNGGEEVNEVRGGSDLRALNMYERGIISWDREMKVFYMCESGE